MFKLNDKVVYPGQGVASIEEIIEKSVAGKMIKFFRLKFLYKDMTILIPVDNKSNNMGIRHLNTAKEIDAAVKELLKVPKKDIGSTDFTPSSWNKRQKDYQLKIQGGDLRDIAGIYRDLMHISKYKELSFGEKNLLVSIEELMVQEIGVTMNKDRADVISDLRAPFQQVTFPGGINNQNSPTASAI